MSEIHCTKEFIEDMLQLSKFNINITNVRIDDVTGIVIFDVESDRDSKQLSLSYSYDEDVLQRLHDAGLTRSDIQLKATLKEVQ